MYTFYSFFHVSLTILPLPLQLYGPPNADQIAFPPCESLANGAQVRHTTELLNAFDRGLVLECHNGCVYATRKSRLAIS